MLIGLILVTITIAANVRTSSTAGNLKGSKEQPFRIDASLPSDEKFQQLLKRLRSESVYKPNKKYKFIDYSNDSIDLKDNRNNESPSKFTHNLKIKSGITRMEKVRFRINNVNRTNVSNPKNVESNAPIRDKTSNLNENGLEPSIGTSQSLIKKEKSVFLSFNPLEPNTIAVILIFCVICFVLIVMIFVFGLSFLSYEITAGQPFMTFHGLQNRSSSVDSFNSSDLTLASSSSYPKQNKKRHTPVSKKGVKKSEHLYESIDQQSLTRPQMELPKTQTSAKCNHICLLIDKADIQNVRASCRHEDSIDNDNIDLTRAILHQPLEYRLQNSVLTDTADLSTQPRRFESKYKEMETESKPKETKTETEKKETSKSNELLVCDVTCRRVKGSDITKLFNNMKDSSVSSSYSSEIDSVIDNDNKSELSISQNWLRRNGKLKKSFCDCGECLDL